jgi:hypothetical protein
MGLFFVHACDFQNLNYFAQIYMQFWGELVSIGRIGVPSLSTQLYARRCTFPENWSSSMLVSHRCLRNFALTMGHGNYGRVQFHNSMEFFIFFTGIFICTPFGSNPALGRSPCRRNYCSQMNWSGFLFGACIRRTFNFIMNFTCTWGKHS